MKFDYPSFPATSVSSTVGLGGAFVKSLWAFLLASDHGLPFRAVLSFFFVSSSLDFPVLDSDIFLAVSSSWCSYQLAFNAALCSSEKVRPFLVLDIFARVS